MIKYNIYILFFLTSHTYAAGYIPKYEIPKTGNLSYKFVNHNSGYVFFSGHETIEAKFELLFNEELDIPDLIIYPSKQSLEKLPFLTERGINEKAHEIHIHNLETISNILFGYTVKENAKNTSFTPISGYGVFTLNNLHMGYECDNPYYIAHILNVKKSIIDKNYVPIGTKEGC